MVVRAGGEGGGKFTTMWKGEVVARPRASQGVLVGAGAAFPRPLPEPDAPAPVGGLWGPRTGTRTAAGAAVACTTVAAVAVHSGLDAATAGLWLLGAALPAAAAGALLGTLTGGATSPAANLTGSRRALGAALIISAGILGVLGVLALASGLRWSPLASGWAVAAAVAGTLALLGRYSPLGPRAGGAGAAAVVGAAVLWGVTAALVPTVYAASGSSRLGAVTLVVSVVALGLPPRLALDRSGLAGPDGHRARDAGARCEGTDSARAAAHRELGLLTVVLVASAVAGGWIALNDPRPWTVSLAVVAMLLLLVRARAYPLTAEVWLLLGAALALLVRLVAVWLDRAHGAPLGPLALAVGAAAVPFVLLAVGSLGPVGERRLRQLTQCTETVGTLVLLPLLLGSLGMYAHLADGV